MYDYEYEEDVLLTLRLLKYPVSYTHLTLPTIA